MDLHLPPSAGTRPRIAVIPERFGNVLSLHASIRLFSYFDLLRRAGHATVRFLLLSEIEEFSPDIIVWHRNSLPDIDTVQAVQGMASRIGARTVYDLDDNLLDRQDPVARESFGKQRTLVDAVRESVACADQVWCTTPHLEQLIATYRHHRVEVLPDALDPDIWGLDRPPRNSPSDEPSLRLLYMATRTHDLDFGFMQAVMETLHRELPGSIELYLLGARSCDDYVPPWLKVWEMPANAGPSYPAFVRWLILRDGLDMGVAPLLEGRFNDCKSPIKVLDYAAMGLPSLVSDAPAYRHSLGDGINCFRAPNDVRAWVDKLRDLTTMQDERGIVYRNARALVSRERFTAAAMARLALLLGLSRAK